MRRTMMRRMWLAIGIAGLLALLVAACGNDDDGRVSPFNQGDDGGSGSPFDQGDDDGGPSFAGPGGSWSDSECFELGMSLASLFAASLGGGDFDSSLGLLEDMSARVPGEVRQHFDTISDAFTEFYGILDDAGWNPNDPQSMTDPEVQEALAEAGDLLDSQEVDRAFDEVERYFDEVCPQFD